MKKYTGWGEEMRYFLPLLPLPEQVYRVLCIPLSPELSDQLQITLCVIRFFRSSRKHTELRVKKCVTLHRSLIAMLSYIKAHLDFNFAYLFSVPSTDPSWVFHYVSVPLNQCEANFSTPTFFFRSDTIL